MPSKAAASAKQAIEKAAQKEKFSLQHIDAAPPNEMREAVQKVVQSKQYFQVYLPDGSRLVHGIERYELQSTESSRFRWGSIGCMDRVPLHSLEQINKETSRPEPHRPMLTTLRTCRDERHPMNFGREVLAALVGAPDRADWRKCTAANSAEEEQATTAFRDFFLPFSPASTK